MPIRQLRQRVTFSPHTCTIRCAALRADHTATNVSAFSLVDSPILRG
jgi:hypothetical protein